MRNVLKVIALAALIGVSTAAYAQQKSITIAGIPNEYRGKTAMLALAPSPGSQSYTAYSLVIINDASVTFPLLDWKTDKSWSGSGNFAFIILIGENAKAIANSQFLFFGSTAATASVSQAATAVQWSQFLSSGQPAQQPAQQQGKQKSITLKGLPGNYRGKTAMLALATAPNSQSYVAYSLGTISDPKTITFPLSDWTTDKPWSGSGDFAFIILIGETAQAIASNQLLYLGSTAATSSVNQDSTTIQWSQFLLMKQDSAAPAAQQPARPSAPKPSAPQPAASAGPIYIITGSGTAFSATTGGAAVGTAGQPIKDVINAIRTHAAGKDCQIQFGNGTAVLDLGTATAEINNSGGTWGTVTLRGKVTSATGSLYATVDIEDNVSAIVINGTEIANTGNEYSSALSFSSKGTLTISGGAIRAVGTGLLVLRDSCVINISGGTISSTKGNAMKVSGDGIINISGNAVITAKESHAIIYPALPTASAILNITGGTVEYTGPSSMWSNVAAIYAFNDVTVNISGGNIKGGECIGILRSGNGTVTISGNAVVSATTGTAIQNSGEGGTLTITGGTVSSGTGTAILNYYTLTKIIVSGTANITSANTKATEGTIRIAKLDTKARPDNTEVRFEMTGGTVTNTSKAATGNAIRSDSTCGINITGGTVSTASANGFAINNTSTGAVNTAGATIQGKVGK